MFVQASPRKRPREWESRRTRGVHEPNGRWHRICCKAAHVRRDKRLSGHLRVLLADSDAERAILLEERLREITDAVILRIPPGGKLLDAVAAESPDFIIVDMARPDRDGLDDLRRVSNDNPRPVIMFVDRDDRGF